MDAIATGVRDERSNPAILPQRGDMVLVQINQHNGKTFDNFRKWYPDGEALKPTKQGVTIPLHALPELHKALEAYLTTIEPAALTSR